MEAPSSGAVLAARRFHLGLTRHRLHRSERHGLGGEWKDVTGPISDFGSSVQKITMETSGGTKKAVPTALTTDGSSFKVTWKHE